MIWANVSNESESWLKPESKFLGSIFDWDPTLIWLNIAAAWAMSGYELPVGLILLAYCDFKMLDLICSS